MSLVSAPPSALAAACLSTLEDYDIVSKCGEGTYGCVFKALHKKTRQLVALKKVVNVPKEEGAPVEIKYLKKLCSSKNVVNLRDYFWNNGELCIVFEYMDYDLWRLMTGPDVAFTMFQIKCIIKQMLEGLQQCHSVGIMHRDIKPSNLLINTEGTLKLADFGLTTSFVGSNYFSNNVVSLYYRPPELLMGSHIYGPEIDMWSVGCILVEMITNNYLFAGSNESEQLDLIFRVFGTPSEQEWPGVTQLPGWGLVDKRYPSQDLKKILDFLSEDAFDLVTKLLSLDPKKRISSTEALKHTWFCTQPLPCTPDRLPKTWPIGSSRSHSRKYQSDFPRSRKLYIDSRKDTKARRGRKAATTHRSSSSSSSSSSSITTGRAARTSRFLPYSRPAPPPPQPQCKLSGHSAQFPIVIAS